MQTYSAKTPGNKSQAAADRPAKQQASQIKTFPSVPVQAKKGDLNDPHEARESKPVYLSEVQEAVIVPGLAVCAAVRVNVFQNMKDEKRLVHSAVLHSEGKVNRSKEAALEINNWIIDKCKGKTCEVRILVMLNGNYSSAIDDHAPVLNLLTQGLSDISVPHDTRTEIIKSNETFLDVNLSGTEDDIMKHYAGRLKVPASKELTEYRKNLFTEFKNTLLKSGLTEEKREGWIKRWGDTESKEEVDTLKRKAMAIKVKTKKKDKGCYLTTACTEFAGLADDCYELTTLRSFRDNYMAHCSDGPNLIAKYYSIAPTIVKRIDTSPNRAQLYMDILNNVRQCVRNIEQNKMEKALQQYQTMVSDLHTAMM